ncbi:MAG: nuclease-related domain-containing protein [Actinomycetota bacterium]
MIPRRAGQFTRQRFLRLFLPLLVVFAVGFVLAFAGFVWWPLSLVALVLIVVIDRIVGSGSKRDPVPWLKGARGEEAVGRILAELETEGYRSLHDIDTGHGNVDHVVVGPTGVVAFETKHWSGQFLPVKGRLHFNGRPALDVLKQAQRNAMEVKRRLARTGIRGYVDAVVVSTRATVAHGELTFGEAPVVEATRLGEWIRTRRGRLTDQEIVRAIAAILRGEPDLTVRSISYENRRKPFAG